MECRCLPMASKCFAINMLTMAAVAWWGVEAVDMTCTDRTLMAARIALNFVRNFFVHEYLRLQVSC